MTHRRPPAVIIVIALITALYGWAIFVTSFRHPGLIGPDYDTPGTDYMVLHAGISTALRGDIALLYNPDRFTAFLNDRYHTLLAYPLIARPFVYPPSFLVLLLPFAPFAFLPSYLFFQISTAGLLAASLCSGAAKPRPYAWIAAFALFSPAASVNVLEGQVAFLTTALLVAGTRLLPRHRIVAGILFGLLSVKPQHALLVPVMLVALGAWSTLVAAGVTALVLAAFAAALFGLSAWSAWIGAISRYASVDNDWDSSLRTCVTLLGANATLAAFLLAVAMAGGAIIVFAAYRRPLTKPTDRSMQLAILLVASNLVAPHTGPYDTILQVVAVGLFLLNAFETTPVLAWVLGLCIWLIPLFGQPLISPIARFAPLLTVTLLAWLHHRRVHPNAVR